MNFFISLRSKVFFSFCLCLGLASLWGCTKKEKVLSDFELYNLGTNAFEEEKYQKAREYFQKLEGLYPDSQYLSWSRVGLANTYYEEGVYEEAITEYQKVIEFYPLNKLSEWSQYRIGMAHFQQRLEEDRDQEETGKACLAFERFLTQYAKNPLAREAREKYQICLDQLAGNELYIAKFYFKSKAYEAAINRLEGILVNHPLFSRKDEVLYYLARAYEKEGNKKLSEQIIKTLTEQYRESEFTRRLLKEESDKRN